MKQHKWHKEIKAWADGAKIELRFRDELWEKPLDFLPFNDKDYEFRIKPQPKEPQYLYVWKVSNKITLTTDKNGIVIDTWNPEIMPKCIGKIKLETE